MDQLLTRTLAIKENMDPRGVKWGIGKVKGTALYHVDILAGNKLSSVPQELQGKFTSPVIAQKAIENYLDTAWTESEAATRRLDRKANREDVEV